MFLFYTPGIVSGTPTGLNNIPTADVVPEKVLVFQGWSDFGEDRGPSYFAGFKFGHVKRLEVGVDGRLGADSSGPLTAQLKYQVYRFDFGLIPLVGIDNISTETDKAGKANPYVVLTQDLKFLRIHLGHNFQDENEAFFGGIDKSIRVWDQELILRADLKQTNQRDDLLGSAGFLLTLPYNLILECWVSIPSQDDIKESYIVKINYVVRF